MLVVLLDRVAVGLLALLDEVRVSAGETIERLTSSMNGGRSARVRTLLLTGDHDVFPRQVAATA